MSKKCECCDKDKKDCTCKCECSESYIFNKFMDDILIKETKFLDKSDSPNRERAKRHQERPLNRIKFGSN